MTEHTPRADLNSRALAALADIEAETSWRAGLGTLIWSLLAFVVAGWLVGTALGGFRAASFAILILAVLVHEAGHYVAMRRFGYRNLRMFFIPLLGAAVTGHACVPVVEQSIVYLSGPVPGLVVGYVCAVVHLLTNSRLWLQAARIFVLLNALNLVSLYPLDGGQFLYSILPRRSYRYQWTLQAALLVFVLYAGLWLNIDPALGLASLATFGTLYLRQLNKAAIGLLERGVGATETDWRVIPLDVALAIIQLVRKETTLHKPKDIARAVWMVWARARAPRPNVRQAAILLAAYALALLTSLPVAWALYHANLAR